MVIKSLIVGGVLVALGVAGYIGSGAASVTALIPAFIGAVLVVLGLVGRNERWRKHAMHGVMLVALLAIAGTYRGIAALFAWLGGTPPERPMAVVAQVLTAALCAWLLVAGVRSFIAARRDAPSAG
jgi:high-affinity Fe2+/Pb2+ permease